jgi:nucleoside-diphosphate kinase
VQFDLLAADGIGLGAKDLKRCRFTPGFAGGANARYKPAALPESDERMTIERTLSIIKPDATRRNLTGAINDRFEKGGLRIIAQKRIQLSRSQAERFYEVHAGRPFYRDLVAFMSSGPVVVQVLEGENAVALNRELMGATNPANAAPGTIRKDFAESIEANSAHGSDSPENAAQEIAFFFSTIEICP